MFSKCLGLLWEPLTGPESLSYKVQMTFLISLIPQHLNMPLV